MKNLKKLSRERLISINGGIEPCIQNCLKGYRKCCIPHQAYYCVANEDICL
ncbi:hypothetical protein M2347_004116 [Chryseobacterium sp. H1D6B]|uniref:bacteriocin-like protein n=1 Tax=Chryseobacterium sp. H1D6B TaxID=2940588 RepID=UPI0015CD9E83|nr:hypothetical protein [Chryseobacterium sp. H1D6B]MDH6254389.1 hypothetical protein [Chryseobacterium sp. H1D6B]